MVHTLTSLHAGTVQTEHQAQRRQAQQQQVQQQRQAQQQQQVQAQSQAACDVAAVAAADLARALGDIPTEAEMEQAEAAFNARQQQHQAQQQAQALRVASARSASAAADEAQQQQVSAQAQRSASASSGVGAAADVAQQQLQPSWTLGEAHRSSAALDGSALRQVPSIPPASDEVVKQTVLAMAEPEDLVRRGMGGVDGAERGTRDTWRLGVCLRHGCGKQPPCWLRLGGRPGEADLGLVAASVRPAFVQAGCRCTPCREASPVVCVPAAPAQPDSHPIAVTRPCFPPVLAAGLLQGVADGAEPELQGSRGGRV